MKRVVLRRVEHLEQRARRIALERDAELVDLVEQEDRVLGAGLLHPLDDAAGHGADVGAPVAADVGLVARAAERDADVLAPHRAGDRLGDRRLADARRTDEQQDRPARRRSSSLPLTGRWAPARWRWRPGSSVDSPGASSAACARRRPPPSSSRSGRVLLHAQLAHGEELEHPVLHVAERVVILVEDLLRPAAGRGAPRCARSTAARRSSRDRCG